MGKETGQIAQLTLLQPMHTLILVCEKLQKFLLVDFEKMAETLTDVPVEGQVGPILGATLDDHVTKLDFLARADLKL